MRSERDSRELRCAAFTSTAEFGVPIRVSLGSTCISLFIRRGERWANIARSASKLETGR
jgi:hypothetical protein